ncbi:hypothetical protein VNI00_008901 [Paramarasmius palmivorus]|uniref:Uncharacterized protein n=1 Tax=Paramarasmius palmivorus TaxID=297713 RepID=A0AAW0CSZ3_9AGAR
MLDSSSLTIRQVKPNYIDLQIRPRNGEKLYELATTSPQRPSITIAIEEDQLKKPLTLRIAVTPSSEGSLSAAQAQNHSQSSNTQPKNEENNSSYLPPNYNLVVTESQDFSINSQDIDDFLEAERLQLRRKKVNEAAEAINDLVGDAVCSPGKSPRSVVKARRTVSLENGSSTMLLSPSTRHTQHHRSSTKASAQQGAQTCQSQQSEEAEPASSTDSYANGTYDSDEFGTVSASQSEEKELIPTKRRKRRPYSPTLKSMLPPGSRQPRHMSESEYRKSTMYNKTT